MQDTTTSAAATALSDVLNSVTTASPTSPSSILDDSGSSAISSSLPSTPDPPLTLSLGSWQIDQEDLPIYVGSAAGVLLLVMLLLAVTAWRCCLAPVAGAGGRRRRDGEKHNGKQML